MKLPPPYFDAIAAKASARWDQLEQDRELAGPWHQLFKQVQSPRHVLSELLQNADDAGASEASVLIDNETFVFEHDGEDFAEQHFASLCRFGYSNKRALHTIGFRGIGFKSTFSLGSPVEVHSPTLAVAFDSRRFTEPRWLSDSPNTGPKTQVRVPIADAYRQRELEKNLEEWLKSPVSLLFFRSIRKLRIGDRAVRWLSHGSGPIPASEWVALEDQPGHQLLVIRSGFESFPEDALAEIRQERMLGIEDDAEFPPSTIEIVLGTAGRLFVVLPTGIETKLPFACNAPFIQDPARLKIKDPETSPTNRWLLRRAGCLAATAIMQWLGRQEDSTADRANAYKLFPDVDRTDSSLEGGCGAIVEEAFGETINDQSILLTEEGSLTPAQGSVVLPIALLGVWPADRVVALFDEQQRAPLSRHVTPEASRTLQHWGLVDAIDTPRVLATLQSKNLPQPQTWRQLLMLWAYVARLISSFGHGVNPETLRIVPVQGRDMLVAASEVVRLGERKLLHSDDDWEFLASHLAVLNQNWTRFLAEQRRDADDASDGALFETVENAYTVLAKVRLDDTSDVSRVVDQFAAEFFRQKQVSVSDCVRLAQISAKLGATVGDSFRYVTCGGHLRSIANNVLFDADGTLSELVPPTDRNAELLHSSYMADFQACTRDEWLSWVTSGRAGLKLFFPILQDARRFRWQTCAEREALTRGFTGTLRFPYSTGKFVVEDWDFRADLWSHWLRLSSGDDRTWIKVAERILGQGRDYWGRAVGARILQIATTKSTQSITNATLLPNWLIRLRALPCLVDTRGCPRLPGDLLRRTPETESLLDVEPFIHSRLDTESARPLLDLLGVRSAPTGPDRLLDCLRALSKAEAPPVHEVDKWFRRLDQMVDTCSTPNFQRIQQAFREEKLILSQDGSWMNSAGVFLASDEEDAPGAPVIRASVADLTLWAKIGVAPRPTSELALQWLKGLRSGALLPVDDARRVRALLPRYPVQIWQECGHWLNLAGEWVPTEKLAYSLTMQSLIPWRHLHSWVKQETADLQRLAADVTSAPSFVALPTLASRIEERLQDGSRRERQPRPSAWLTSLAADLRRAQFETEPETERVRTLAALLARTQWFETSRLEVVPYLDGVPAGTPRQGDALWQGDQLLTTRLSKGKLAKRLPEAVGKQFNRPDIQAALDYSFERSPDDVAEYMRENFLLVDVEVIREISSDVPTAASASVIHPESRDAGLATLDNQPAPESGEAPDDAAVVLGSYGGFENVTGGFHGNSNQGESTRPISRARGPAPSFHPNIMERFAVAHGFRNEGDGRFRHADGGWIARTTGSRFPWERYDSHGVLVRYYLAKEHCLQRESMQIEADAWALIERHPDTYSLILATEDDTAVELTGTELRAMRDAGELGLFPATYRIAWQAECTAPEEAQ